MNYGECTWTKECPFSSHTEPYGLDTNIPKWTRYLWHNHLKHKKIHNMTEGFLIFFKNYLLEIDYPTIFYIFQPINML